MENSPLGTCKVLDLTDEKGLLCGKILAGLGADVIKVERPGGDPARLIGPFYRDERHPEKSLPWLAFNTGKRSITLDIEGATDRETFLGLAADADFLVESFQPGCMARLDLDFSRLHEHNPTLIYISISGFGQTGPYRDYKAPDIVVMALSGEMNLIGKPDRAPLRIGVPQAYLHAGAEAAAAALIALWWREQTGRGQYIDVSAQECVTWEGFQNQSAWDVSRTLIRRLGPIRPVGAARYRSLYRCRDGHLFLYLLGGSAGAKSLRALAKWMDEEGLADERLRSFDWDTFEPATFTTEGARVLEDRFGHFFATKTKRELLERALSSGIYLAPVMAANDLIESPHLEERGYWVSIAHEEIGANLLCPGAPFVSLETPYRVRRRAPLVGEHNDEVISRGTVGGRAASADTQARIKTALHGIKVADFSWSAAGPVATRYLADHGATVVRVESIAHPDIVRMSHPYKDNIVHPDRAGMFANYNANKYGVTLDLHNPHGKEIAQRLVQWADVFVENFSPRALAKLSLDYNAVRALNPSIVYLSTTQMGQTGPLAPFKGYGGQAAALAGFLEVTGYPNEEPVGVFGGYTDFIAYRYAVIALLNALLHRRRTGKGQYIDQSQLESALHFLAPVVLDYCANGRVFSRSGNKESNAAPHDAYRCKGDDRWCVIAVYTEEEWQSFCRAVGEPTWTADKKFSTLEQRKAHEKELDRLVESWTMRHTPEEVMHLLQQAGVAAGLVATAKDLHQDPQFKHRGHYWLLDHPVIGPYSCDAPGFRLSETPAQPRMPAPCLGEHNYMVCTELLGLSDEELTAYVEAGAFA